MSETSRNSSQTGLFGSRRRPEHFSLEELSEDDVGYDADVEVVRPEYEDADSANEDHAQGDDSSADSEDYLAHRLRDLYCDPNMVSRDTQKNLQKGRRKRMSKDMDGGELVDSVRSGRSDMEILELEVHTDEDHPAKRQRNGSARPDAGDQTVRMVSEEGEENRAKSSTDSSMFASSPISIEGPATISSEMRDFEMAG